MDTSEWDREIQMLYSEVRALRTAHTRSRMQGNKPLIVRKIALIQSQINLESTLDKIKKIVQRDHLLLPREKTVLHWGKVFSEKLADFYALHAKVITRTLWIKLIKCRLTGQSSDESTQVEPDELVDLAIRQAKLDKTEKYLTEALVELRQKREKLMQQYRNLDITDSNRISASSLQTRLGRNLTDALNNPSINALEDYFRELVLPIHSGATFSKTADRVYSRHLAGLVGICRKLILRSLSAESRNPTRRFDQRFQTAMRQLSELETQTIKSYEEFQQNIPRMPGPILMQKRSKKAKTLAAPK